MWTVCGWPGMYDISPNRQWASENTKFYSEKDHNLSNYPTARLFLVNTCSCWLFTSRPFVFCVFGSHGSSMNKCHGRSDCAVCLSLGCLILLDHQKNIQICVHIQAFIPLTVRGHLSFSVSLSLTLSLSIGNRLLARWSCSTAMVKFCLQNEHICLKLVSVLCKHRWLYAWNRKFSETGILCHYYITFSFAFVVSVRPWQVGLCEASGRSLAVVTRCGLAVRR